MLDRLDRLDRHAVRHVLMRAGLGYVLAWFGVNELRTPSDWAVFAPRFVVDHSPVAINTLVIVHGFLLSLAAAFILLGVLRVLASLLAVGLLAEIMFGLWLNAGVSDLVVRDAGLLMLAAALAFDPVHVWQLESVLPTITMPLLRALGRVKPAEIASPEARAGAHAVGAALLATAVAMFAFLAHATGSNGSTLPSGSVASLSSASSSAASRNAPAAAGTALPTGQVVTTVLFNTWRYKDAAFKVYPGDLTSDAKRAMSGFVLSVQQQGSSTLLSLNALNGGNAKAQLSVQKGDTAYFIETSLRDDPGDQENNLGDDGFIAVNSKGFIVAPQ